MIRRFSAGPSDRRSNQTQQLLLLWPAASLLMAGLIVVPQIVVALLSPWVGYHSDKWGRRALPAALNR
jgi:hypothetical protein